MDKALLTMIGNIPEKTGKSLEEWKIVLKQKSFAKHSQGVKFLKEEYNVTHGFANTIVTLAKEENNTPQSLIESQYKGKENLYSIYKELIKIVESFGTDIVIVPKKGTVSILRKKQFALIKPATKTRVDLGLKIKDKQTTARLENSGPFGAMCTHRVRVTDTKEIDHELIQWLNEAYQKAK